MELVFMGTGTSQGVPLIADPHKDLDLDNPHNWRTRTSAHMNFDGFHVQIDAGPEFRLQCLKNGVDWIDMFILTHGHADHIAGMDDLRRFCDRREGNKLGVFTNEYGAERVRAMFPYALHSRPVSRGYPCFELNLMPRQTELPNGLRVYSEELEHGPVKTLGLIFEFRGAKIAYYTDCKWLTPRAVELARGADALVLDCLRYMPHPSHMTYFEAVEAAEEIGAHRTFFTHITGDIDVSKPPSDVPASCEFAYDGLKVEIPTHTR